MGMSPIGPLLLSAVLIAARQSVAIGGGPDTALALSRWQWIDLSSVPASMGGHPLVKTSGGARCPNSRSCTLPPQPCAPSELCGLRWPPRGRDTKQHLFQTSARIPTPLG